MGETIQYQGYTLPKDAKTPQGVAIDQSNNPALVVIGGTTGSVALSLSLAVVGAATGQTSQLSGNGIILPADVHISCPFEKVVAESGILDGVDVTEHIRRKACEIEFSFTLRNTDANGNPIFPDADLNTLIDNVFTPNKVQTVQSTLLNSKGITQIIILKVIPRFFRGYSHIAVTIVAKENVPGTSLTISKNPGTVTVSNTTS